MDVRLLLLRGPWAGSAYEWPDADRWPPMHLWITDGELAYDTEQGSDISDHYAWWGVTGDGCDHLYMPD